MCYLELKPDNIYFGQNLGFPATVKRFSVRNSFFFVRCFFFQLVLILLLLLLFGYSRLTALASWVDWFSSHVQTKKTLISRCSELKEVRFFVESKTFFCQTRKKTWNSHHRVHLYLNTALVSGIRNLIGNHLHVNVIRLVSLILHLIPYFLGKQWQLQIFFFWLYQK